MIKTALITLMWCALAARCAAADPAPDAMRSYKKVDGKDLELSVFLPYGYVDSSGTIAIFHGGGGDKGEPDWHNPDCAYWRSRGMIAVSVDYQLKTRDGRNPHNPFFYWSLELEDRFLVKHRILCGPSKVAIPEGVKQLQTGDFDAYRGVVP